MENVCLLCACVIVCWHVQANTCTSDLGCSLNSVPAAEFKPYQPGSCAERCCFKGAARLLKCCSCIRCKVRKKSWHRERKGGSECPDPSHGSVDHSLRSRADSAQNWMTDTEWSLVKIVWECIWEQKTGKLLFLFLSVKNCRWNFFWHAEPTIPKVVTT